MKTREEHIEELRGDGISEEEFINHFSKEELEFLLSCKVLYEDEEFQRILSEIREKDKYGE